MLFYVLYVIFCWVTMYYYLSIVPNLTSKSLISSYSDSTIRSMISYLCFLAISTILLQIFPLMYCYRSMHVCTACVTQAVALLILSDIVINTYYYCCAFVCCARCAQLAHYYSPFLYIVQASIFSNFSLYSNNSLHTRPTRNLRFSVIKVRGMVSIN